jgi:hypothetical protein
VLDGTGHCWASLNPSLSHMTNRQLRKIKGPTIRMKRSMNLNIGFQGDQRAKEPSTCRRQPRLINLL